MDDSDRQFLAQCFADMKLDHRLRTEKLSEAFCKMLDRQAERIAFLEKALKQAEDYFIIATLEKEIPKYTVSRDYVGQEVIILDGYSEQSFVATTEQLPELAQYLKERP